MSTLKKKFKEIIDDLEKNIKNKEDLEYVKSQVYNVALLFLDELDKITEVSFDRLNFMVKREKELANKITKMEKIIDNLQKEVFVPQDEEFEIVCPYCNTEFVADLNSNSEDEVKCPECGNSIELDWNEDDDSEPEIWGCNGCDDCDECLDDYDEEPDDYDEETENEKNNKNSRDDEEEDNEDDDM